MNLNNLCITVCVTLICCNTVLGLTSQHCPFQWRSYGNSCYRFYNKLLKTWPEAKDWCMAQNADLVKLETLTEKAWVYRISRIYAGNSTYKWWTGLNNRDSSSRAYTWGDGSPVDPRLINGQHIRSDVSKNCVDLDKNGFLNNIDCSTTKRFICERAVGLEQGCDADRHWVQFSNYCYKYHGETMSWKEAAQKCDQDGGSIISIQSEKDEIQASGLAVSNQRGVWIGLQSMQVGNNPLTWMWYNGSTLDQTIMYWSNGRIPTPSGAKANDTCVWISGNQPDYHKSWNTDSCIARKGAVCKRPLGTCPPGWVAHQVHCFQFNIRFKKSWQDAENYCVAEGGHMMSIYGSRYKDFLNSYLDELASAQVDSIWLGASDNNNDSSGFYWTSGGAVKYQNWLHNPPQNTRARLDCSYIQTGDPNGKWRTTIDCTQQKAFVCKVNFGQQVKTVTTPKPAYKCPDGWLLHAAQCHQFNDTNKSWLDARSACKRQNADLITIYNPDMQTFVQSHLQPGQQYWIGLHDRAKEGKFTWLDEFTTSSYFHWAPHQPDNRDGTSHGSENCVVQWSWGNHGWNDANCSALHRFICQKNADNYQLPVTPPTTTMFSISKKCGLNWEEDPNTNWCYQFHDEQLDWNDARGFCQNQGGELASIQSREEQFFLGTRVQRMTSFNVWIGANDFKQERMWTWSDGSGFPYLNWAKGQPDDYRHNEDCVGMWTDSTKWNDFNCNTRNGFICKKYSNVPSTVFHTTLPKIPAGWTVGCPSGWTPHGGACYLAVNAQVNWLQAQQSCHTQGGSLASINSQDEQNFVSTLLPKGRNGFWLGLNDRVIQMNFQWTDGTPVTYTHWNIGEPNNYRNQHEDCVAIYLSNGRWNDYPCGGAQPGYVCKQPIKAMASTQAAQNTGCQMTSRPYGSYCYEAVGTSATWQNAQKGCAMRFKGTLATVNDRFTQAFVSEIIPSNQDSYWIGLSDSQVQGKFAWVSNTTVQFTYWDKLHTGNEVSKCVVMQTIAPKGLWTTKTCTERHRYVCQYTRTGYTPPITTPTPAPQPCSPGYVGFGAFCYRAFVFNKNQQGRLTWKESVDYCRALGGDLVSFHSQAELDFIQNTIGGAISQNYQVWIGFNDRAVEAGHTWSDSTAVDFTKWNPGEPNDWMHQEDCVAMGLKGGGWYDMTCDYAKNYICKVARGIVVPSSPPTASTSTACGSGWLLYNNNCYTFSNSNGTYDWHQSRVECNNIGAHLASVHSLNESLFLTGQASKYNQWNFWIGLNDIEKPSSYVWSDGTMTDFVYWWPGEPNDYGGGEGCVNIGLRGYGGMWQDEHCNVPKGYVCKKPLNGPGGPITTPQPQVIKGGCPVKGFRGVPGSNKCYKVMLKPSIWKNARSACQKYPGGDLATINSFLEQEFLILLTQNVTFSAWIGLKRIQYAGVFAWSDNRAFNFQNWAKNEPNSSPNGKDYVKNSEGCVEMYTRIDRGVGKWNDKNCDNVRPFVCEVMKSSTVQPPPKRNQHCATGFTIRRRASCYKYVTTPTTWAQANAACKALNTQATTVIINDVYEEAFIQGLINCPTCSYWIGMSDQAVSGTYQWPLSWPVTYTNWGDGEPTRGTGEGCVAITNKVWNDTNCASKMGYVCELNNLKPPAPTQAPTGMCAPNQQLVSGYCYYFSRFQTASWPEARYRCQQLGMDLASVNSKTENSFIWQTFLTMKPMKNETAPQSPVNIWIGLNKGLTSGFQWSDNSPVSYLNWGWRQPSDALTATNEECVEMITTVGKWNDVTCYTKRRFVCKKKFGGVTYLPPLTQSPGNNPGVTNQPVITNRPNQGNQGNHGNQGHVFPSIKTPSGSGSAQQQSQNPSNNSSKGLSGGGIAGVVIAVIVLLAAAAVGLIFFKRRFMGSPPGDTRAMGTDGIDNKMYFNSSENTLSGDADA